MPKNQNACRADRNSFTADYANPRHAKETKAEKALRIRQQDFDKMDLSKAPAGAYHRPGSNQR